MLQFDQSFIAASQFALPPFDLVRPRSLEEYTEILAAISTEPCYLAGGTDLFIQFREGLRPELIVDINKIAELSEISRTAEHLSIGAGVRHEIGVRHTAVKEAVSGLDVAWALFGNVRTRAMGTLGGNLMARRARYEGPILATALNAKMNFLNSSGIRTAIMQDIWDGSIAPDSLLTSVDIPLSVNPRLAYDRSLRPIMTVAAVIEDGSGGGYRGRAVVGSEWNQPVTLDLDLTGGKNLSDIAIAARDISRAAFSNFPKTVEDASYKREAGAVLLKRLLVQLDNKP